jgi:uncharacterized protein YecE (DUF72 family)
LQLYIGCSGWSYSAWLGYFYPKGLEEAKYLEYYSQVFDYVEIDSSFYQTPNQLTVSRWARVTPKGFRFTTKFPKSITHDKRLGQDIEGDLDYFYKAMAPLANKLCCLLLQLPPSMTMKEGLKKLKTLPLDKRFRYAVEARHKSWFDDEMYSFLKKNEICLVWSQLAEIQTPPVVTTDFIYLRFIGDRSIDEKDFGMIQKDRIKEMEYWASIVKKAQKDDKNLKRGFVAANNHYASFGPGTANIFRKMLGLQEAVFEEKKQTTLSDF